MKLAGKEQDAAKFYQKARDVGAQHGFFSVECKACTGLGRQAIDAGRLEEGLELLRNAMVAAPLTEEDASREELMVLQLLTSVLLDTDGIDELEPLIPRYRAVAKAEMRKSGQPFAEIHGMYITARLHEVLVVRSLSVY